MSLKNTLTNEKLTKRFDNVFALVNYAIDVARKLVRRGELEMNPANEVLEHIVDQTENELFDDLDEEEEEEEIIEIEVK